MAASGPSIIALLNLPAPLEALVSGLLERDGYSICAFRNIAEARAAALGGRAPDLIASGLEAPDLEGWELCRLLRSAEGAPFDRTPVLLLSATMAGAAATRITTDLGGDGLLSLPLEAEAFVSLVRNLLSGGRREHRKSFHQHAPSIFAQMLDGCALHEMIFDAAGHPVDYRFLDVNPAFERITGLAADSVIGRTVKEVLPETEQIWIENYGRVVLTGEPFHFESYHAGLRRHFDVTAFRPCPGQFACIFSDVTERAEREKKVERMTRLHAVLSQINQAVVRSPGRDVLFKEVCRVAGEFGNFGMTWVDSGDAGAKQPRGCAVVRTAMGVNHSAVGNVLFPDGRPADCDHQATELDIGSCASFPIRRGGEVCGAFCIRTIEEDHFDAPEVKLLDEIALDISFALDKFDADDARERAAAAERASEANYRRLFEHLAEGFAHCRMIFEDGVPIDWVYLAVNPAFEHLTGLRGAVGKRVSEIIPGLRESDPRLFEIYGRVASGGGPERFEMFVEALGQWFSVCVYSHEKGHFVALFDVVTDRKKAELALRESESKFSTTFRSAPIMMVITAWDDGTILEANEKFLASLGFEREELAGKTIAGAGTLTSQDLGRIVTEINARGRVNALEIECRSRNGQALSGEYSGQLITVGGRPCLLSTIADLTERKQHEAEREMMLRLLRLLNAPTGLEDLVREVTAMMKEWCQCDSVGVRLREGDDYPYLVTLGFPAEFVQAENYLCARDAGNQLVRDSRGNPVLECMCGNVLCDRFDPGKPFFTENGSFWTNSTSELLASTTEADRQCRTRNRCNGEGYESVALVPLRAGGQTLGLLQCNDRRTGRFTPSIIALLERAAGSLAIALDQRRTLEALRTSREQYRLLADHTYDWEFWIGPEDTPSYHSPACERITGYSAAEFLRDPGLLESIIHPDDRPRYRDHVRNLSREQSSALEFRIITKQGGQAVIARLCRPVHAEDGRYLGRRGSNRDTTEQKRAAELREKLQLQLLQAQKMESVGRLAGGVAHDFNNLLTVINGYCDLMLPRLDSRDPFHGYVNEVRKGGQRAADLTKQLLAFSRRQVIEPKQIDLNELLADSRNMLGRLIGEDIELVFDLAPYLGPVLADAGQLQQILMNLVVNARDAMPSGGRITIKTSTMDVGGEFIDTHPDAKPGQYVLLGFSDTGIGMDQDTLKHVFEPFFTTKAEGIGTGLGLATTYGIVKQCGGWIDVASAPGSGATFTLGLPVAVDSVAPQTEATSPPRPRGGWETVLVVEDQEELRRLAAIVLQRQGYKVLEASNGEEALAIAAEYTEPIHLVLTDVVMPGMTGKEMADRLKVILPGVRILYMSGYTHNVIETGEGLDTELEYLPKPFAPQALANKVRAALDAGRKPARILVVDDDAAVRRLYAGVLQSEGYDVVCATDGDQALEWISRGRFDLVITDLVMPNREGIEMIRAIRESRHPLKIIAISGAFNDVLLKVSKKLGADTTLMKPVSPLQLIQAVRGALS